MDIFSERYNQWIRCDETNSHPEHPNLYRVNNWWYNEMTDRFIHKDKIEEYMEHWRDWKKNIDK